MPDQKNELTQGEILLLCSNKSKCQWAGHFTLKSNMNFTCSARLAQMLKIQSLYCPESACTSSDFIFFLHMDQSWYLDLIGEMFHSSIHKSNCFRRPTKEHSQKQLIWRGSSGQQKAEKNVTFYVRDFIPTHRSKLATGARRWASTILHCSI